MLLHRLQQHCPALLDGVDLIAGTSTGGFVALALATCMTPQVDGVMARRVVVVVVVVVVMVVVVVWVVSR